MTDSRVHLPVDLWSTGYNGYQVQRPLVEALIADGRVDPRIVFSDATLGSDSMKQMPVPQCSTVGTRNMRSIPAMLPSIVCARKRLFNFYAQKSHQPIVHITMASPWDQFYIDIPKKAGAKILLVIHDAERHLGEESWVMDQMEKRLILLADNIIVLTEFAGERLRQRLNGRIPIHVVSPGLVINSALPSPAKTAPNGRPIRFLFFGRIHAYKGLDILLDAWAQFRTMPDAPPATLSIVGSGDIEPYRATTEASQDITVEHGWITDARMQEVFSENDVNILPYREGSESGNALAGMWAGMPSIATRIGCFAEKLFDRENALITNIDAPSIAAALYEIAKSPPLYTSLAAGTERLAQDWRASEVAAKWVSLYQHIGASA